MSLLCHKEQPRALSAVCNGHALQVLYLPGGGHGRAKLALMCKGGGYWRWSQAATLQSLQGRSAKEECKLQEQERITH